MRRMSIALALVVTVILSISLVAPVIAADEGSEATVSANVTEADVDNGELTLEELRQDGPHYSNSPPSVRISDRAMFWVVHWPADRLGASPGDPNDDNWEYLSPNDRVDRNAVYLRTIRTESGTEPVTIHVAYYDVGTRLVEQNNGTTTEQYASNVTVQEVHAELATGWPIIEVPLRQNDQHRHVTMWVAGQEDDLRWTFEHRSVATTQDAGISSEGDYLFRVATEFALPLFVGVFGIGYTGRRALANAGKGPGWGYARWIIVISIITIAIVISHFSTLAEALVAAPLIMAAYMTAIVGVVIIETYTSNVSRAAFFQPLLSDAVSPSGEEVVDMIRARSREELVVRMNDNTLAVVRPGLLPFLSRCFGGAARLENAEKIKTKIELTDSPIDELYFVNPDASEVLEYKPEGWQLDLVEPKSRDDWLRIGVGALAIAALGYIATVLLGSGVLGVGVALLGIGLAVVRPEDGYARIYPAPAHERSAWASMLYLTIEHEDAETIDKARETIIRQQARSEKDVDEALQKKDSTLIDAMFENDIEASIEKLARVAQDDREEAVESKEGEGDD